MATYGPLLHRRQRSAIPNAERHRPKWQMAIEMIDELIEWGCTPPTAVADAGYGDTTAFREALTERGIDYVVAIKGATSAHPGDAVPETAAYTGRGRPPTPRYGPHTTRKDLVLSAGRQSLRTVTWRQGTKTSPNNPPRRCARGSPRCESARRTATSRAPRTEPCRGVVARRMAHRCRRADRLLARDAPEDTPLPELVRLAKIRLRVEHDSRELKTGLGLDHFEGRSWLGWHHHATLVTAAHLFFTTLRLADPKATGQD